MNESCSLIPKHVLTILKQFSFPGNNKFLFTMVIIFLYTDISNNEGFFLRVSDPMDLFTVAITC